MPGWDKIHFRLPIKMGLGAEYGPFAWVLSKHMKHCPLVVYWKRLEPSNGVAYELLLWKCHLAQGTSFKLVA